MTEQVNHGTLALVVDDEPTVRELVVEILKGMDLFEDVLAAGNANAALGLIGDRPERFRLVISDNHMPGMGGEELLGHLLELGIKRLILMSGGTASDRLEGWSRDMASRGAIAMTMAKPFTPKTLMGLVRHILGAPLSE